MSTTQLNRIEARLDAILAAVDKLAVAPDPSAPIHKLQPSTPQAVQSPQEPAQNARGLSGIRAADLTPEDLVYLRHVQENGSFRLSQQGKSMPDLFHALLLGSDNDMNAARNGSMDRADVQGPRSQFLADPAAWVAKYQASNPRLVTAYNKWINEELAK